MNAWEVASLVRERLKAARWPTEAQEFVFNTQVYIVAQVPGPSDLPNAWPAALIFVGSGRADPDERLLETRQFTVAIAQIQESDPLGEDLVMGGPGPELTGGTPGKPNKGTSMGRGLLELASEVKRHIGYLHPNDGLNIIWGHESSQQITPLAPGRYMGILTVGFSCLCTSTYQGGVPGA